MERACFEPYGRDGSISRQLFASHKGSDKKQCLKLQSLLHGRVF
jgi:hypothetical protein